MTETPLVASNSDLRVEADGSLHGSWSYLYWKPGDTNATLDGDFTAAELRAIADHMDKVK